MRAPDNDRRPSAAEAEPDCLRAGTQIPPRHLAVRAHGQERPTLRPADHSAPHATRDSQTHRSTRLQVGDSAHALMKITLSRVAR